jgi:hypothetical protein
MRRKSFWLTILLALLIGGGAITSLVVLTQHEPAFYLRSIVREGEQRQHTAHECIAKVGNLVDSIKNDVNRGPGTWIGRFNEEELNSCLQEHYADSFLPEGVSEPRISFEQDRVRLGFRYGKHPFSTIISIDFRVWLAQGQPNVVVLELQRLHAGALPISAQSLLEDISNMVRRRNIQVSWYRHNGNPAAVLKFQADQPRAVSQLRQIILEPTCLTIMGDFSE